MFLFKRSMREAALRHGIYATFLAKPMDPESMFATILKWLSARNTGGPAQASPIKFSD